MSFSFGLRLHFSLNASKSARDVELPFMSRCAIDKLFPSSSPFHIVFDQ